MFVSENEKLSELLKDKRTELIVYGACETFGRAGGTYSQEISGNDLQKISPQGHATKATLP